MAHEDRCIALKTWKVQSKDGDQEDAEDGADAERGEHGGARRQAVARQWPWSKTVPSRRMQGTGGHAEDDAGVETVSKAGAAREALQSERWC